MTESATTESTTDRYRAARDFLQESSRDYARAVARFAWPDFGERFNWAIDWFDAVARGVERTALWIVEEDGSEANGRRQRAWNAGQAQFDGPAAAGRADRARRPGLRQPADEGEICVDLCQRPLSPMTGYQGAPERNAEAMAGGYYRTGDVLRSSSAGTESSPMRRRGSTRPSTRNGGRAASWATAVPGKSSKAFMRRSQKPLVDHL